MTNEAAERLLEEYGHFDECDGGLTAMDHEWRHPVCEDRRSAMRATLNAALAAERRATVERIRAALLALAERYAGEHDLKPYAAAKEALAILDAEAAR